MKSAQRQFVVMIDGMDKTPWGVKSGGEITADTNKVWDGGSLVPEVLSAPAEVGDVTISRPYDPERDQPLINSLKSLVGHLRTTITVVPTNSTLVAARVKPTVYSNALLSGLREPETDASSGDAADYELTFAVGAVS